MGLVHSSGQEAASIPTEQTERPVVGLPMTFASAKLLQIGDLVEDADDGTPGHITGLLDEYKLIRVKFGDCFPMGLWPTQVVFAGRPNATTAANSDAVGTSASE